MNTVEQILTVKDYSGKKRLYKRDGDFEYIKKPVWLKVLFVVIIALAAMGEWKVINRAYGGLPKAITLGALVIAFFYGIVVGDYFSFKKILKPTILYVSLIILIMLTSIVIWVMDFAALQSIIDGGEEMIFQLIAVLVALSGIYLFGKESINLVFIGFCTSNAAIMMLEVPNFGLLESIRSVWHCVITFGDAYGYARSLELHEMTFLMGQFLIYYAAFAPYGTKRQKWERWIFTILSLFFFVVGMKRIAMPAAAVAVFLSYLLRNRKNLGKILVTAGIGLFSFMFVFLNMVKNGTFADIMASFGVDMMGREHIWNLAHGYYEISPSFAGLGFEAVDTLIGEWYREGLMKQPYSLHNDLLKVFIELGFWGFCIWTVMQYVIYTIFWNKSYNSEAALVYMCLLIYMTATYMTDNTAFYFWPTMGIRLIPLAYALDIQKEKPDPKWVPPLKEDMERRIRDLCRETV